MKKGDIVEFRGNPNDLGIVDEFDGKVFVWCGGERMNVMGWSKSDRVLLGEDFRTVGSMHPTYKKVTER